MRFTKKVLLIGKKSEKEVDLFIDTGSEHSTIDKKIANELGYVKVADVDLYDIHMKPTRAELTVFAAKINGCKGHFQTVVSKGAGNTIGASALQQLGAKVDMKNEDITITHCEPYHI